jgi:hypothetical protein
MTQPHAPAAPPAPVATGSTPVRQHVYVLASVFEWKKGDLDRFTKAPFAAVPTPDPATDGKWIVDQYVPAFRDTMFFDAKAPEARLQRFRRELKLPFDRVLRPGNGRATQGGGTLVGAEIFAFPNGLGVFCVEVDLGTGATLADVSDVGGALRSFESMIQWPDGSTSRVDQFVEAEVLGGIKIRGDGVSVDEYSGSKLKTFLAVDLGASAPSPAVQGNLLYDLGCMVTVGSAGGDDPFSPTKEYLDDILEHKVSVFSQWSAVGLYDSFVAVGGNFLGGGPGSRDAGKRDTWRVTYLRVYVYNLHQKFSAQRMAADIDTSASEDRDKNERFLLDAHLPRISYNFLPNLLHGAMRKGLDVDDDLETLETRIAALSKMMEEEYQKRSSALLFIVSMLTGFQTIQDTFLQNVGWLQEKAGLSGPIFWTASLTIGLVLLGFVSAFLWPRRYQAWRRRLDDVLKAARS